MKAVKFTEYGSPDVLKLTEVGKIKPPLINTFPWSKPDAHRYVEEGNKTESVVITIA